MPFWEHVLATRCCAACFPNVSCSHLCINPMRQGCLHYRQDDSDSTSNLPQVAGLRTAELSDFRDRAPECFISFLLLLEQTTQTQQLQTTQISPLTASWSKVRRRPLG